MNLHNSSRLITDAVMPSGSASSDENGM